MGLLVLTNDDGINAPGIRALQAALRHLSAPHQSVIVAPDRPHSGCSHQMNRGSAIKIEPRSPDEYAIGGTPADCSRVALSHLYPEADWVLSGINAGGNMGADIHLSGTVAAVREAALLRKPGIAISQYKYRDQPFDWPRATRLAASVLGQLMGEATQPGQFWNVNLPAPPLNGQWDEPEVVFCQGCTQPLPTEFIVDEQGFRYTGAYEDRPRDVGRDVAVCLGGHISVVSIQLW
ncbi:MAG: 5'/3'-nucleotidase SurE [Phormidesmis sp. RL_2_1]|nr:5'/3'-nucleotidase SurE [Phormidesmis sp. RL_2_1]